MPAVRLKLTIRGAVQGVGFRPFIYRLATELDLTGWVNNSSQGVFVEIEGSRVDVENFLLRIEPEKPPRSFIQSLEPSWLNPAGYKRFEIRESQADGSKTEIIMPDLATCPDCLREIFDPEDRRHLYPFTNCTNCGPRFSIIESMPCDRHNTSMKKFTMCQECRAEYDDPTDRRFHAQPNACSVCGPQLELWDKKGSQLAQRHDALLLAADEIRRGRILALKGLGGFHLMVAAQNDTAVQRLRDLKHREEKPFALMFPTIEAVRLECEISPLEERLLWSAESPIVLLRRLAVPSTLSQQIAPGNPQLGVLLPYTPLHYILLSELGFPVVATSGNLSDEPICKGEMEALERLGDIADVFLVHNRPIVRAVDDSLTRIVLGREMILRRARGYAPLPITLKRGKVFPRENENRSAILAVGAHLKNTSALCIGSQVFISQHIGDLENLLSYEAFRRVTADFQKLFDVRANTVASDAHPDYLSTKYANELAASSDVRHLSIQHHIAHVLACMADNELDAPVLGISWDGTGYGTDGMIWGGEFFDVRKNSITRAAHLRPFRLPGGDKSVKEPRRTALGLLFEMMGDTLFDSNDLIPRNSFSTSELITLRSMLKSNLNSPPTSSIGRLFDAVAGIIGLRQTVNFEGQAAMEMEFLLEGITTDEAYAFAIITSEKPSESPLVLDWQPVIEHILRDMKHGTGIGMISAKFHNSLVRAIISIARHFSEPQIVLTGECFQNRYLLERSVKRLTELGFRPYWHQRVPPNDGGIALGQIIGALRSKSDET